MRTLLYQALVDEAFVAPVDLGTPPRIYQAGSLGIGDVPALPDFPHILIRQLPNVPYPEVRETSDANARFFWIWTYDIRGDYGRIDSLLAWERDTVKALTGQKSDSGALCIDARLIAESQDLVDAQKDLIFRYCTVRLVTNN